MSVDRQFIGSLLDARMAPSKILDFGVYPEYFTEEIQKLYLFIKNHYLIHGQVPSDETLFDEVGTVPDYDCPEPPAYYAEKIIKRYKENTLKNGIKDAVDKLKGQSPEQAEQILKELVSKCSKIGTNEVTNLVNVREVSEDRARAYLERMAHPELATGIKWPWPYMNHMTQGMQPGELYFIVARLKQGKTWTIISVMDEVIKSEVPAMVVSMEMPVDKVIRRFESKFSSIGFGSFAQHSLTTQDKEQYIESVNRIKNGVSPLWVVGNGRVRTVQDVELLIKEKKPRVVMIDGVYLMGVDGGSKQSKWERVSAVVDELQKLSQREQISIIATSQFNRGVKKGAKDGDAGDVGFAYEIGQAADILMSLAQDEDMKLNKEMVLRVLERREGECFNLKLNWNFETMDFSEIGAITDEELSMSRKKDDTPDTIF